MNCEKGVKIQLDLIGELPPYFQIADRLWGEDVDIYSDGNSISPESTCWDELTLILRSDETQRIDIDPADGEENTLILRASTRELAMSVVSFLRQQGSIK